MAMTTRFRSKPREENHDPANKLKLLDSKLTANKTDSGLLVDEKRKAFGDIHNRREIISIDSKKLGVEKDIKKGITGVFKDVKPRVDTRWKKAESTIVPQKPKTAVIAPTAITRPLSRQNSIKNNDIKKEKSVKTITDAITNQIKKTTTYATGIDLKKSQQKPSEVQFIHSPKSIKKKEKQSGGVKYFESHSSHLISQVDNIDENDRGNPQLLSEYVNDIYAYMMKLEDIFPIRSNFLETQMDVTPKMRSVLLDWINEVHHQFNLENETFHMAVSMIDRYLQAVHNTPRKFLQLVGVTALFMASKYEELMPPEIGDFVYVTDDTYGKEQILQMEMKMFKALDFQLCKPLPIHFLRRYAKAAGSLADRQYIAAKYFIELACIDYELSMIKPSEIAAASLYLSLYIMNGMKNDKDLWTPTLEFYSTYTLADMLPVVKRLALIVSTAQDAKLKSIYNKYANAHFKFTSTIPEMTGIKIQNLIRSF
ncbi:G2/mitotic-specific cyclin-B [Chironomus tepperi]|uniref:G2/mitotic-specific cyclin-B n=1 Tax=Chironomus tepperi TaxID=113505 RepID=UPI00391F0535